jgi:hypothetical protein
MAVWVRGDGWWSLLVLRRDRQVVKRMRFSKPD